MDYLIDINNPQYDPRKPFVEFQTWLGEEVLNQEFNRDQLENWILEYKLGYPQGIGKLGVDHEIIEVTVLLIAMWVQCNFIKVHIRQDVQTMYEIGNGTAKFHAGRRETFYKFNNEFRYQQSKM